MIGDQGGWYALLISLIVVLVMALALAFGESYKLREIESCAGNSVLRRSYNVNKKTFCIDKDGTDLFCSGNIDEALSTCRSGDLPLKEMLP